MLFVLEGLALRKGNDNNDGPWHPLTVSHEGGGRDMGGKNDKIMDFGRESSIANSKQGRTGKLHIER